MFDDWEEPEGFCGNCAHCDGVDESRDVCRCRKNDPHADWRYNGNETCPKWKLDRFFS